MGKKSYIIGKEAKGFEKVKIKDAALFNDEEKDIVVVLDRNVSYKGALQDYYGVFTRLLKENIPFSLIIVGKESEIKNALCNLMVAYGNYRIYKVGSSDLINEHYLAKALNRVPDIVEVQEFVSAKAIASSEGAMLLLGLKSLVEQEDIDGLKVFVEENERVLLAFPELLDYLKKIENEVSLDLFIEEINKQKQLIEDYKVQIEKENVKTSSLTSTLESTKDELAAAQSKLKHTQDKLMSAGAGGVIKTYSTIDTKVVPIKVPTILYFKEISPVKYTASLIAGIMEYIKKDSNRVTNGQRTANIKLLIYDSASPMLNAYGASEVIDGTKYKKDSNLYSSVKTESLVVTEPIQALLETVLNPTIGETADVLIIYDRLRQKHDIITGTIVTKIFVVGSSNDYVTAQNNNFGLNQSSLVIVPEDSVLAAEEESWKRRHPRIAMPLNRIAVPVIPQYEEMSLEAGKGRYMSLNNALPKNQQFTKNPLIIKDMLLANCVLNYKK